MNLLIAPDESEFQPIITDKFGRRLLILRVAFGAHYQDAKFLADADEAARLYKAGEIDGVILYQVWLKSATAAEHFAFGKKLIGPTPPEWLIGVMLDLEVWRGQSYEQHGDHSKAINALYGKWCGYMGSWNGCGLYGNQADLAELAPHRDKRAWVIVAAYGTKLVYKNVAGAIGQQYTDGQAKWGVPTIGGRKLPRITDGVACDHNVFDPARFPTAKALRAFTRPKPAGHARPAAPKPPAKPAPYYTQKNVPVHLIGVSPDRQSALFLGDDNVQLWHHGQFVRNI